jgi:hypothetical protein
MIELPWWVVVVIGVICFVAGAWSEYLVIRPYKGGEE